MGQTTVVFPRLKKWYRNLVKNPAVDRTVHAALNGLVSLYAKLRGYEFPCKFDWDWKWEMLSGAYERDTVALFKRIIKPGMSVVDVGAHIGYFTKLYSKLVGPNGAVYAFEADPGNYVPLENNCRGLTNVHLFKEAIADRDGTIDFFETENNTGCHSLVPSNTRPNKLSVPCATLDSLVARETVSRVDVIKLDIEGGEPQALRGMARTIELNPRLAFVIELCPDNLREAGVTPEALLEQVFALGLRVFAIKSDGLKEITPELARQGQFFIASDYHYVNIYASREPIV